MSGIELGPFNIRVNSISPGAIATPIFTAVRLALTLCLTKKTRKMEKLKNNLAKAVPLKKAGVAQDMAKALYT